jgi:hypothetical protein
MVRATVVGGKVQGLPDRQGRGEGIFMDVAAAARGGS